jgi:8-oxo-dGTP diphosphatase
VKKVDVVGAVILNDRGEVLCAKRSAQMSLPNMWEFPGGKIEPSESPEESLRREILEELGCTIEVGALVAECTYTYPTVIVHLLTFYARITEGEPKASEHECLAWVPRARLPELTWAPADLPTVERLWQTS